MLMLMSEVVSLRAHLSNKQFLLGSQMSKTACLAWCSLIRLRLRNHSGLAVSADLRLLHGLQSKVLISLDA